jgi:Heterokaryon incompatibility protein (HET)
MRLLKLGRSGEASLTKDFVDNAPPYAILSHTWGEDEDELTFHDLESGSGTSKTGYIKIQFCGKQAKNDGLEYFWVDTCCINKSSSAELSEAINSMFRWYQNAARCYVYLSDVSTPEDVGNGHLSPTTEEAFGHSKWFTRGWTLQELIAPAIVEFFSREGHKLGDKRSLEKQIHEITGIALGALRGVRLSSETSPVTSTDREAMETENMRKYSIAQKMSWASKRVTTRVEDRAYCLMGLFDVYMPLIYGEGERAFLRLQEEIIQDNDDQSIFAWSMGTNKFSGLLAPNPASFAGCEHTRTRKSFKGREPFSITNRGLSIRLNITPWLADTYLAYLECSDRDDIKIGIFLRRLTEDDQYARINLSGGGLFRETKYMCDNSDRPTRKIPLFVRKYVDSEEEKYCLADRIYGFRIPSHWLPISDPPRDGCVEILPPGGWGQMVVVFRDRKGLKQVTLGFDFDFNPVCILNDSSNDGKDIDAKQHNYIDWSHNFPDDFNWYEIEEHRTYRRKDHDGTWALRGDRLAGLDVLLSKSPMHTTKEESSIVSLQRDEKMSPLLWVVTIDNRAGPFVSL